MTWRRLPTDLQPGSGSYREYAVGEVVRPFVECLWTRDSVVVVVASPRRGPIDTASTPRAAGWVYRRGARFSGRADEPESAMAVGR
jgi:hypothetical protein